MQSRQASCAPKRQPPGSSCAGSDSGRSGGMDAPSEKNAAVDLNLPEQPEVKARKAHCFVGAGRDFRAIRRQSQPSGAGPRRAVVDCLNENCLDHRTVQWQGRPLPEAFQNFLCARKGGLPQQMRCEITRLKVIILPEFIHDTQGFVGVLAGFQAEPIGNLGQNLIRDVVDAHKTDRRYVLVLAVRIAVIELQRSVQTFAKFSWFGEGLLQLFDLFVQTG